jgi:hypothetical protein
MAEKKLQMAQCLAKKRKIKQLRNLASEKEQRQKDKEADLAKYDSATKKLKDDLQNSQDQYEFFSCRGG